ncbi:MAG: CHAT domain-containing protein, partial [Cytophagales bacterium]
KFKKSILAMIYKFITLFLIAFTASSYSKFPAAANQFNSSGQKEGHWVELYDSLWNETKNEDSAKFFRTIRYQNGKSIGKVRDFYANRQKQWEGFLISIKPEIKEGESIFYFENGKIQTTAFYVNNKKNGPFKEYFPTGILNNEGNMKLDSNDGVWRYYHETGELLAIAEMKKGNFDGSIHFFYKNGNLNAKGFRANNKSAGYWETYFENGKINLKQNFLDDLKNGNYEEYNEDGFIVKKGKYLNDKEVGNWEYYHSNGVLNAKGVLNSNGLKEGKWFYYDENGVLSTKEYIKNGLSDGFFEEFYPSQKKKTIGQYKNNVKDSVFKYFHENGNLKKQGAYLNDSANGKWSYYYESGKPQNEGFFVDNKKNGQWKWYFENGDIDAIENIEMGFLEGDYLEYYPGKKTKTISSYKKGKLIGKYVEYYENGNKKKECFYDENSNLSGDFKIWNENGKISVEAFYKDNLKQGIAKWYRENGKLDDEYIYKDGEANGEFKAYHENGKIYKKGNYKNGTLDSKLEIYSADGNIYSSGLYENGKRQGLWFYIDSLTHKKEAEGMYKNGLKDGKWIVIDANGKKISNVYFINGFKETVDNISDSISSLVVNYQFEKAEQAINWLKKVVKRDNSNKSIIDSKYAFLYYSQKKYDLALKSYTKYAEAVKISEGDTSVNYGFAKNGILISLEGLGRSKEAIKQYPEVLNIYAKAKKRYSESYGVIMQNYASSLINENQIQQAQDLYENELRERRKVFDSTSFEYLDFENNLGWYYSEIQNYKKAVEVFKNVVSKSEKNKNELKGIYKYALRNLANKLDDLENYREALETTKKLLNFKLDIGESNTLDYLQDFKSKGVYFSRLNMEDSAKYCYEYVLKVIYEQKWENTLVEAQALNGLAIFYSNNNEIEKSLTLFPVVLNHYTSTNNKQNSYYTFLTNYANILYKNDASTIKKCIELIEESMNYKEINYGSNSLEFANSIITLSHYLINDYQLERASKLLSTAQSIIIEKQGKESIVYIYYLKKASKLEVYKKNFTASLAFEKERLKLLEKYKNTEFDDYIDAHIDISRQYYNLSKQDSAMVYSKLAIDIYKKNKNETDNKYLELKSSLAADYKNQNLYSEAEKIYVSNLAQYAINVGKQSIKYANELKELALCLSSKGEKERALKYSKEYQTIIQNIAGEYSEKNANALQNLSNSYEKLDMYSEAEIAIRKSLKIIGLKYGEQHLKNADKTLSLAIILQLLNKYSESEKYYLEALKIVKQNFGNDNQEIVEYQKEYANLCSALNKNKDAEELYLKNIEILNKLDASKGLRYTKALSDLSNFYLNFGRYADGEKILLEEYKIALEIKDKILIADNLVSYASLLNQWKKYPQADSIAQKSLSVFEDELEINNYRILSVKNLLGLININRRKFEESYKYLDFCIKESKINKTDNTLDYGFYLNNQSVNLMEMGKFQESEKMLKESSIIIYKNVKKGYNDAFHLDNYATLYQVWGKYELAEKYWQLTTQKVLQQIKSNFYFLSDNEKAQYWALNNADFEYYNSFAVMRYKQNPNVLSEMYNNQLATKGLLLSTSNKIKNRILSSKDTVLISDYHTWIAIKEKLVKAYLLSELERKNMQINIQALEKEANVLEKNINITSEDFDKENVISNIGWKDIQKNLTTGEAAIEIIRFRHYHKHLSDSVIYAALILTAETKLNPKIVLLEKGNLMETKWLKYYNNNIKNRLNEAQTFLNYWAEIEKELKGIKKVYVSPDGVYNSINLNTLQDENDKYLIEKYDIKIVSNTKDIIKIKKQNKRLVNSNNNAILFGFPKFFIGDKKPMNKKDNERAFDAVNRSGIADLPGTKVEIEKINTVLSGSKWNTKNFIENQANEEELKSLNNPKVLHIATHGLFIDEEAASKSQNTVIQKLSSVQNHLLKVGLLLSGSANYLQNETYFSEDNGILTAYEAANLNLEGTEMVVLSACETGKGEIQNGEGVYGLQRAFQTAGAKTIVMSLWKVDDNATQELMSSFYTKWTSGIEKTSAFNQAQLEIKQKYKMPYYWGAFVMVGE